MAEVRLCFGRRVYDFASDFSRSYGHLFYGQSKCAREVCRLSAGFLIGDTQYNRLYGAEDAADALTVELCQRVDARGPSRCGSVTFVSRFTRSLCAAKLWGTAPSPPLFWRRAWMYQSTRAYSGNGIREKPLYKTQTGYYEVLEVPPTATQAQIKTAYYKQSFIYHPDRNSGSDQATTRFSEISEAYTVLGSKVLRKKYDRGLLSLSDLTAAARPSGKDSAGSPVKQQPGGSRSVAGQHVRGGVSDFDMFYKSHYKEQLQRQRDMRVRQEEMLKKEQKAMDEKHLSKMLDTVIGILLVTVLCVIISLKRG